METFPSARMPFRFVGATYARISTAQQKDGISLDQQHDHMVAYAAANNIDIPAEYRFKEQESGYKSERSDYNKIRELARDNLINVLIVYGSDRHTRDPIHGEIFRGELRRNNVALHIITEGGEVDIISPTGQFLRRQMDNFNWYWGKMIQQTTQDKKLAYMEQGVPLLQGTPPFGYIRVGRREHGRLEICEEEAGIVRRIYIWFDEGYGGVDIITMLAGTPTPSDFRKTKRPRKHGYGRWNVGVIYHILRSEVYAGVYHAYKRRVVEGEDGERRDKAQPRSDWRPMSVPAIVDRELWDRVQQRLKESTNRSPRGPQKYEYLVSRRAKCHVCGYSISGSTVFHARKDGSRYEKKYYRCNTWQKEIAKERCSLPYVPARAVDATIWNYVKAMLSNPKALASSMREAQEQQTGRHQELLDRISDIDDLIAERTRDLEELARSFPHARGMLRTVLQQQADQLEETIRGLQTQRERFQGELDGYVVSEEDIIALETFARRIGGALEDATFETKRRVIEELKMFFSLAKEGDEFVVYVRWLIKPFKLTVMEDSISH